ncbi:MAG TPA: hypothetical protein VMV17_15820 [Streptosporangiaceae bacterium]|nr:hypothetical protein [Streptosporangiaceae bacterium]
MAWPPPGDPVSLRDAALDRTRRLSWGIAAGALAATATLGFAFARALPGHAAQAGATARRSVGPAAQPAGRSHSTRPHRARSHTSQQGGQASAPPAPAPAPAPPPPQVTSGGS